MAGLVTRIQDCFMVLRYAFGVGALLLSAAGMAEEPQSGGPAQPAAAQTTAVTVAAPGKNPDPWEKFNRGVYRFNDVADRYVLKPVAKGYKAATPEMVRIGVTNFFINLRSPLVVMNDLLQGKFKQAGGDTLRFVVNSTVGVVGVVDVAARINLPLHDEDFGQTLGVWGVPSGPYVVLPFMGPSSVRDGTGLMVDAAANPRRRLLVDEVDWILFGVDVVNSRASLLDLEDIIQGDRYLFIRDLYLQRRAYSVQDGQIEADPFLDDDSSFDEPGAAVPATEDEAGQGAADAEPASNEAPENGQKAPASQTDPATSAVPLEPTASGSSLSQAATVPGSAVIRPAIAPEAAATSGSALSSTVAESGS